MCSIETITSLYKYLQYQKLSISILNATHPPPITLIGTTNEYNHYLFSFFDQIFI
jgi:hypothetical protein